MTREWPQELDQISRMIGESPNLVQGPGGNTSWKSGEDIWVKASGAQLKDAESSRIFCRIRRNNPLRNLEDDSLRPSIESYLHAIIPKKYVIHVHSVGAINIAIRKSVDSSIKNLLSEFKLGLVEYVRPGKDLAKKVQTNFKSNSKNNGVILRNHGIVFWGENLMETYKILLKFEETSFKEFSIKEDIFKICYENGIERFIGKKYVTPDHAVFAKELANLGLASNPNWIEDLNLALCKSISMVAHREDITFLEDDEVIGLQNWDAEKYRRTQNT